MKEEGEYIFILDENRTWKDEGEEIPEGRG